uniref:Uncharacterized protein n=1 Tax=Panagrolaimus sp. ES5 TaxID=591445 RepID=A0AC34FFK4_9BILA
MVAVSADPDEDFEGCCRDKSVPDACLKYCTYDRQSSKKSFHASASVDGECRKPTVVSTVLQCLQKGKDNRECCKAAGIGNDYAFCLDLCDGTTPLADDENDQKYEYCTTDNNSKKIEECAKNS